MRSFSLSLLGSIAVLSVAASSAGAKELVVPFATGGRPTTGDASTATNPAMDVVLADVSLETALEQALNMTTELVAGTISEMVAQHRRSHLRQRENRLKERAEVAEREEIEKRSLKLRYPYGSEKVRGVSLGGW